MTQRGPRLRRKVAAMRHTGRALALMAILAALVLTPVVSQAAMHAVTRTRFAKARHEMAEPISPSMARTSAKSAAHGKRGANRDAHGVKDEARRSSREARGARATHDIVVAHGNSDLLKHGAKPLRVSARITPSAMSGRGRRRSRQAEAQEVAQMRGIDRLRNRKVSPASESLRVGRNPAARGIAEHTAQSGTVPRSFTTPGGELTIDQFMQVASAAAEGTPTVAASNTHIPAPVQRVDGFGAEGAVLSASAPPATSPVPPVDSAAVASAVAGNSRIRALVQPSHEEMAVELSVPVVLPGLYRNGRLIVPAPMKGSHEILVHQNTMANDEGLERVRNEDELQHLRSTRQLVDFAESVSLRVNPELGSNRRCARVWTVKFAEDIARAYYARFHEPLQINSAVRTVAYQLRLQRTNGNAAAIAGEASSPHLTGQAIDFGKRGMSVEQIAWMRAYLKPMMDVGKVDVEEEFQQACFHISVYRSYLPTLPVQRRLQVAALAAPIVDNQ